MDLIKVNEFEAQAKKVYLEVYNGNINALDAFAAFKLTEDVCKNLGGKLKSDGEIIPVVSYTHYSSSLSIKKQ